MKFIKRIIEEREQNKLNRIRDNVMNVIKNYSGNSKFNPRSRDKYPFHSIGEISCYTPMTSHIYIDGKCVLKDCKQANEIRDAIKGRLNKKYKKKRT